MAWKPSFLTSLCPRETPEGRRLGPLFAVRPLVLPDAPFLEFVPTQTVFLDSKFQVQGREARRALAPGGGVESRRSRVGRGGGVSVVVAAAVYSCDRRTRQLSEVRETFSGAG